MQHKYRDKTWRSPTFQPLPQEYWMRAADAVVAVLLLLATCASAALVPGAVYAGQYMCGSAAWLLFHVEQVDDEGVQGATLTARTYPFFLHPGF